MSDNEKMADMKLDPKGLAAATAEFEAEFNGTYGGDELVERIISAYLRASPVAGQSVALRHEVMRLVQYHVTDDDDRATLTTALSALYPASAIESLQRERDEARKVLDEMRPVWADNIVAPAECSENCDDPDCPYSHHPLTLREAYENSVLRLRSAEARIAELERERDDLRLALDRIRTKAIAFSARATDGYAEIQGVAVDALNAALSDSPATEPVVGQGEVLERVLNLIEEKLCIVWARPGSREQFSESLSAALRPAPGVVEGRKADADYFVENGALLDIGAGDALAVIENMPETPQEAWAAGWNAARIRSARVEEK